MEIATSCADEKARIMADLIDRWIANPVLRTSLRFITKRGKDGRRAEKVLMDYAGLEEEALTKQIGDLAQVYAQDAGVRRCVLA
ncbi:MAG: hypothetical protein ACE5NN_06145 [Candidatus Bathyarchaeia archaeon]